MDARTFVAACLATTLGAAVAATPSATPAAPPESPAESAMRDRTLVDSYVQWAVHILEVPSTPDVDPALHDALAKMTGEHFTRLRQQLPNWLAEERAHAATPLSRQKLDQAINNRFLNEIALWRLESPGPEYDAVYTHAILHPGVCDSPARNSYLGVLVNLMASVPAADRATLLAGERKLLAHWGQARAGLPARPARSLSQDEDAAIGRLRSGDAVPEVPMPPVLANSAFKGELASAGSDVTCALHQWGLAQALRRGSPASALAAWRYATMRTAADWAPAAAHEAKPTDYPPAAAFGGVTGTTAVEITRDPQGRYLSGRVAERHVDVPGVRDNPPVAFETIFDGVSLATAPLRATLPPVPAGGKPPPPFTLRFNWILQ